MVVHNLWREQQKWVRLFRVFIRKGYITQTLGNIYVAVVQVVIIYRSETWVMTPRIRRVMGGLHHRVIHRLTGRQPKRGRGGGWVYPSL